MLTKFCGIGRLGQDPRSATTKSGVEMTTFRVACNHGYGDKKETVWVGVVTFKAQAKSCAKHLKKGSLVYFEGTPKISLYKSKSGEQKAEIECTVNSICFLSGFEASKAAEHYQEAIAAPGNPKPVDFDDDDIPF